MLKRDNDNANSYYVGLGADADKLWSVISSTSSSSQQGNTTSANTFYNLRFELENGAIKTYIDDTLFQSASLGFTPHYVSYLSWNRVKTLYLEDLKIKPL